MAPPEGYEPSPATAAADQALVDLVHATDQLLAEALRGTGLSLTQLLALRALGGDDAGLTVSELGERLEMSLPSASRLCQRLEAAALVERVGGPRRAVRVRVSAAGARLVAEADQARASAWRTMFGRLSSNQQVMVQRALGVRGSIQV